MPFTSKAGIIKEIQESLAQSVSSSLDMVFQSKKKAIKDHSPQRAMLVLLDMIPSSEKNKTSEENKTSQENENFRSNLAWYAALSKKELKTAFKWGSGTYKGRINAILSYCLNIAKEVPSKEMLGDKKKEMLAVIYVLGKQI